MFRSNAAAHSSSVVLVAMKRAWVMNDLAMISGERWPLSTSAATVSQSTA